jgi:peroxiredoxin
MNVAAVVILGGAAAALAAPQARPLTGTAGAPDLTDTAGTTFAMTWTRYAEFAERASKADPSFVPITKKPDGLGADAMFGINLILRGKNLGWALDGSETGGYVLHADWNGNGDLTDETPLRFDRASDGTYSMRVNREERDGDVTYPVSMRIAIAWEARPGQTEKQLALKNYNRTWRSGLIERPGGPPIKFRISGVSGFYDQPFNTVAFDLDGNGTYDRDTEIFRVSEKRVNLGDTSYEFAVDPHGRTLTLTPLAEHVPTRVALTVGSPAPDFSFTDTEGRARKLSDYRGKVVLLDFWGVWCAPCVVEAPKLVALYDKFHDRGLEIIGLDTLDTPASVAEFVSKHKFRWVQTIEAEKGPIQTLYRINGYPSYLLIDRDGTIRLAASGSSTNLDREVSAIIK